MTRVPVTFPHHGDEEGGDAVAMMERTSGVAIGLHRHVVNPGGPFAEGNTGFDHIASNAVARADLDVWAAWLHEEVEHSDVDDAEAPMPYSTLVVRDPDNIRLELFFMAG